MAEKQTKAKTRKPARTIEQQIADLQAKQEAINEKRAASLAARHFSFTEQLAKAEARVTTIKANIALLVEETKELGVELVEETKELGVELGEASEAEAVEVENIEVEKAEVV